MHNSSQPFDRLQYVFALCDSVTLTFDLLSNTDGRELVMDYPCDKFGDCSLSRFGFIVRTNRHTRTQTRMIAILT